MLDVVVEVRGVGVLGERPLAPRAEGAARVGQFLDRELEVVVREPHDVARRAGRPLRRAGTLAQLAQGRQGLLQLALAGQLMDAQELVGEVRLRDGRRDDGVRGEQGEGRRLDLGQGQDRGSDRHRRARGVLARRRHRHGRAAAVRAERQLDHRVARGGAGQGARPPRGAALAVREEQLGDDARAARHAELEVAQVRRVDQGELLGEALLEVLGALAEVRLPVARVGHLAQERLLEGAAQADRRRRDARLRGLGDLRGDRVLVDQPAVGLAVGEEDHPAGALRARLVEQLPRAGLPSVEERRAAAGADLRDLRRDRLAVSHRAERLEDVDLVIEDEHRHAVRRAETADQVLRRRLRRGERLAAHRAGAVDDDRQVERGALVDGGGQGLRGDEADERLRLVRLAEGQARLQGQDLEGEVGLGTGVGDVGLRHGCDQDGPS